MTPVPFALSLASILVLAIQATQGSETPVGMAELSGTVEDHHHVPLAGVAVEVISGRMRLAQVTGAEGRFIFMGLPVGELKVVFRQDARSQGGEFDLIMSPGQRRRLKVALVAASAGKWVIDITDEGVEDGSRRVLARQDLERLPSTLHLWSLVAFTEVSVTPERFDLAGMHSDEAMLFGSRGGSWSQNRVVSNGFRLTSADGADTLSVPDLSTAENITYDAFHAAGSHAGAELAMHPRVGGSELHGEAQIHFQSGALQNANVTPRLRSFGITESDERYRHFFHGNAQLGGPLLPGLKFLVAFSGQQAEKWIRNHPLSVTHNLETGTANLSSELSSRDRISLGWQGQGVHQPQAGASAQITRQATQDITRTFHSIQGSWSRVISARSVLDSRAAFMTGSTDAALQPNTVLPSRKELYPSSVDIPLVPSAEGGRPIVALLNNVFTGAAPLATASQDRRAQARSQFATLRHGPRGMTHRISIGADVEWLRFGEQSSAFQNTHLRFFRGQPDSVQLLSGSNLRIHMTRTGFYTADEMRMGPLILDFSANVLSTAGTNFRPVGQDADRMRWTGLGGHAGIAYRIGRRYPTVLRAGMARRNHESLFRALQAVHPDGLGISTYSWNDPNQDSLFQSEELGTLYRREGAPFSRLDSSLKLPYTNEIHLGAGQALPGGLSLIFHGFRRVEHRLLGFLNTGIPSSAYTPVPVFDPGDDGASQTGDETFRVAYNQSADTLGQDSYLLTNPPAVGAFAEGYEARVRHNSANLQWELAFTRYRAVAHTAFGNGPLQNDWAAFAIFSDPNLSVNAYGSTYFDRGLGARFWGTLSLPWATRLGWVASFLDGAPYGRILPVPGLDQGLIGILATRRGSGDGSPNEGKRTVHNVTLDLRLSRDIELRRGRLTASIDVFNVPNLARALSEADVTSPTHLWRIPLEFQTPRSLQLGVRYAW